eukprot:CAMPEP_0174698172 /NCGR_PEP_ID=MMETSP1094-20130205/3823_1 /TAXON_ID=156173 /ORGANISM="Chrysochromulina brevifilum, Strain UTEX LB 985" /LENGTH=157 /DNA_ID=CAMNT_0015895283 /DNA_START=534 /DNA_END=1003 /DNA_ORIENTATION=-
MTIRRRVAAMGQLAMVPPFVGLVGALTPTMVTTEEAAVCKALVMRTASLSSFDHHLRSSILDRMAGRNPPPWYQDDPKIPFWVAGTLRSPSSELTRFNKEHIALLVKARKPADEHPAVAQRHSKRGVQPFCETCDSLHSCGTRAEMLIALRRTSTSR